MRLRGWGLLGTTFFALGCSGGGGGSSNSSQNNTAPTVGAINGNQSAQVGYQFSYDATQGENTFDDTDGDTLSYTISYIPNANGLTDSAGIISGTLIDDQDTTATITANDGNGGSATDSFTIGVSIDQSAISAAFNGAIDLTTLENYADQPIPNYITKLNDGGNPITDRVATLGRVLFYDTDLSVDGTISCASCHQQSNGFSDTATVSTGVQGGLTGRHSMRLINTQFADEENFFWDERASNHEEQESQPIQDLSLIHI